MNSAGNNNNNKKGIQHSVGGDNSDVEIIDERSYGSKFDTLLKDRPNNAITIENTEASATTISLPAVIATDERSNSPTDISFNKMSSVMEKNVSAGVGIKLKIFKNPQSDSWGQNEYSSKVEIPSDGSKSSSTCTSAASSTSSSPEPTNELESRLSPAPIQKLTTNRTPSTQSLSQISLPSTESIFPQSTPSNYDATKSSSFADSTLDSSMEFGEIIDQRTGLPSKAYNNIYAGDGSLVDSPCSLQSSNTSNIRLSPKESVEPSTKSYPSRRDSRTTSVRSYKPSNKALESGNSTSHDITENTIGITSRVEATDVLSKINKSEKCYSGKAYGSRSRGGPATSVIDSFISKSSLEQSTAIDVRNSANINYDLPTTQNDSLSFTNVEKLDDLSMKPVSDSLSDSKKAPVPDLFSSGFDEEEIIDRTLINHSNNDSSKGVSSSSSCKSTQDFNDEMLGFMTASKSASLSAPKEENILKKSASLPVPSNKSSSSTSKSVPRKRSIFKSKDDGDKKRATYNHKWHSTNEEKDEFSGAADSTAVGASKTSSGSQSAASSAFDDFDFDDSSSLKRVKSWSAQSGKLPDIDNFSESGSSVTSVKCNRDVKPVSWCFSYCFWYFI